MRTTTNFGLQNNEKKEQNIIRLKRMYEEQKIVTVGSAMNEFSVVESTIIGWCKQGDIPLIGKNGKPVVEFTGNNIPSWW